MKRGIHPQYVECGDVLLQQHLQDARYRVEMKVELCNECHPFYTGQQKFVDTGGRVQRFADKFGGAAAAQLKKAEAKGCQRPPRLLRPRLLARPPLRLRLPRRLSVLLSLPREAAKQAAEAPQKAPVEEAAAEARTTEAAE